MGALARMKAGAEDQGPQRCRFEVERKGGAVVPLEIRVTFDDGTVQLEHWTREESREVRWKRFEYLRPTKVKQVEIDAEDKLILDEQRSNNSSTRAADRQ